MQPQLIDFDTLDTTELSLQQVVQRVLSSGRITTAERIWFHRMIVADLTLTPETMLQVRRLSERLQMGLIKVVD
jgi:hypothetical protein